MGLLIQLVGIVLHVLSEAYRDYTDIKINFKIDNHTSRWMGRFIVVALISCVGMELFSVNHLRSFVGLSLIFTALFDNTLNIMRGKGIGYLGSTAKWDVFWRRHYVFYVTFVPLCLVVGVWLLLI